MHPKGQKTTIANSNSVGITSGKTISVKDKSKVIAARKTARAGGMIEPTWRRLMNGLVHLQRMRMTVNGERPLGRVQSTLQSRDTIATELAE